MKVDRDGFIIVLTFVPIIVGLVLFLFWKTSGSGLFDLPSWTAPDFGLPAINVADIPGFIGLVKGVQRMGSDAKTLAIAIGGGMVAGLLIAGVILDVTRGFHKLSTVRARPRPGSDPYS